MYVKCFPGKFLNIAHSFRRPKIKSPSISELYMADLTFLNFCRFFNFLFVQNLRQIQNLVKWNDHKTDNTLLLVDFIFTKFESIANFVVQNWTLILMLVLFSQFLVFSVLCAELWRSRYLVRVAGYSGETVILKVHGERLRKTRMCVAPR